MKPKSRPPVIAKNELRREIAQLRSIGGSMANLCFNLSQWKEARARDREVMDELYRKWDAIKRAEPSKP